MWEINLSKSKKKELSEPLGYNKAFSDVQGQEHSVDLKKKAWSIATSGVSNIFMMLFMMYMSGSTLNIFSLLIIYSIIQQPVSNLMKVGSSFASLEKKGIMLAPYKLMYLALHLVILAIGLYKLYTIGLLPLNSADWIDMIPAHQQKEIVIAYNYK